MKRVKQFLFLLALLFSVSSSGILSQEQPSPNQFPLGFFLDGNYSPSGVDTIYNQLERLGANYIIQYAPLTSTEPLSHYNLVAVKEDSPSDYISYFSRGYYKKWETEENQTNLLASGVKHANGTEETYLGKQCWSTFGLTSPVDSLVYGPDYRQDKYYRINYWNPEPQVNYTAKFVLGFEYPYSNPDPDLNVCKIAVVHRYRLLVNECYMGDVIDTLDNTSVVLKVSDFPHNQFLEKSLTYNYPGNIPNQNISEHLLSNVITSDTLFDDEYPGYGIQFIVDWYGVGTLYVDYVEVFDNTIWGVYLSNIQLHSEEIISFANNYSSWNFLKYWYAADEPSTLDQYEPMRVVDALLRNETILSKPLITEFNPQWNNTKNGDNNILKYYNLTQPQKLMIDYYPFWVGVEDSFALRWLGYNLQFADSAQPGFWYVGQGFGERLTDPTGDFCNWRKPDSTELKTSVNLALSYGSKGIMFWKYSPSYFDIEVNCTGPGYFDVIVGDSSEYTPSPLWWYIHNNLSPRLNGDFGKTLFKLKYLRKFIEFTVYPNIDGTIETLDYLSILRTGLQSSFRAALFEDSLDSYNKFFLLVNKLSEVGSDKVCTMYINNGSYLTGFTNWRFRDVEGRIDTTVNVSSSITYYDTLQAGEGHLFQVAPVVLYGGRLLYNETVGGSWTLNDDMIIENGATLTVTGIYNANANITVKDGGSIKTVNGGEIIFESGKKLIIEGLATVKGTSLQKLTLDFGEPTFNTGIEVKPGSDFTLSNCIVNNANIGVDANFSAFQTAFQNLNINNTSFDNCNNAVIISGSVNDAKIKTCVITNTLNGITVANCNSLLVQNTTIDDSEMGINLELSPNCNIIGNSITSTKNTMPGILMNNSGGNIRDNTISGHTIGITLANSSPKVGGNTITGNLINGMYISTNSNPDLRAKLDLSQTAVYYPISGYNEIFNNGGYNSSEIPNDDGSEIYILNAKIVLHDGCNQIIDDRIQQDPLFETTTLMNGYSLTNNVKADTNYWGTTNNGDPIGRFGTLNVLYEPFITEPCPYPPPTGGSSQMVMYSAGGEIIDTVYSTGLVASGFSDLDALYANADSYYLTGQFNEAKTIYNQILVDYPTDPLSSNAYSALFMINKLQLGDSVSFAELRNFYTEKLNSITDTVLINHVKNLSSLCLVDQYKYEEAIAAFNQIVESNPNTDAALFAEIDALTTSMIAGSDTTQLGKGTNDRILVKGTADYLSKVNNLLKNRFGYQKPEEEKIIPEQYYLYQNYPNPFNPITLIKFDLPQAGNVELTVYDILGRKVKQLLNETKLAGSYEVEFNASALASGVYIYTIKSNDFTASKKLMLLK